MQKTLKITSIIIFMALSYPLLAQQALPGAYIQDTKEKKFNISFLPEFGFITGVSREIVYPTSSISNVNRYLSLLTWEFRPLMVMGNSFSINVLNKIYLNAGYWSLANGTHTNHMDDYDWFYKNLPQWTHHSNHDIWLTDSYFYDFSIYFSCFNKQEASLGFIGGYKQFMLNWEDRINYLVYTSINENTTYYEGTSPLHDMEFKYTYDKQGISYQVEYAIPYLGIFYGYNGNPLTFQTQFLYTFLTTARDIDHHILTGNYYYDYFRMCSTFGGGFDMKYFINSRFFLNLKANFLWIAEKRGNVHQYNDDFFLSAYEDNRVGIQLSEFNITASIGTVF